MFLWPPQHEMPVTHSLIQDLDEAILLLPTACTWENRWLLDDTSDTLNMKNKKWFLVVAVMVLVGGAAFYAYERQSGRPASGRDEILAMMPSDAGAVVFVDLAGLRATPLFTQLFAASPPPVPDPEYAQFLKETGFNYERDLDLLALAYFKNQNHPTFFAVAHGKFDQQKIASYAEQHGKWVFIKAREKQLKLFLVPLTNGAGQLQFAFPREDEIFITNDELRTDLISNAFLLDTMRRDWQARFERLAGSPVFAVIRQDAAPGAALSLQAPGGFRSPQLSALLDQLRWVSIAGKPDNNILRIVVDGECPSEATGRQLSDILNGVVILAEDGLNDPKTRQHLDPATRTAYLDLLKSANISKVQRGDTMSVRLVLELGPELLEAARKSPPNGLEANPVKPQTGKPTAKKGRT